MRLTVDADLVAVEIEKFMAERGSWEGYAADLLSALNEKADDATKRAEEWPRVANALSGRLRRAAPGLRQSGIEVASRTLHGRTIYTITKIQNAGTTNPTHHIHYTSTETRSNEAKNLVAFAGGGIAGAMSDDGEKTAPDIPPRGTGQFIEKDFPETKPVFDEPAVKAVFAGGT